MAHMKELDSLPQSKQFLKNRDIAGISFKCVKRTKRQRTRILYLSFMGKNPEKKLCSAHDNRFKNMHVNNIGVRETCLKDYPDYIFLIDKHFILLIFTNITK